MEIQLTISNAIEDAYGDAFQYVYYAALAVGGVAIIAALFMKDYDKYMTNHTPKQVYGRGNTETPEIDSEGKGRTSENEHQVDSHKKVAAAG